MSHSDAREETVVYRGEMSGRHGVTSIAALYHPSSRQDWIVMLGGRLDDSVVGVFVSFKANSREPLHL